MMLNPRKIPDFAPWKDVRFGSKADMCSAKCHVRFVPKADIALFDRNAHAADILDQTGHHIARCNRSNALRCSGHNHVARV